MYDLDLKKRCSCFQEATKQKSVLRSTKHVDWRENPQNWNIMNVPKKKTQ